MKDNNGQILSSLLKKQVKENDTPTSDVTHLTALDHKKNLKVIIETPKDSRNKYNYDSESGMFECHSTLPVGMVFPFDFGFIPDTRAEDGDPLDVLLFMDAPAFPGTIVRARLIGVLEANQREKDGRTMRNDRLIAVHVKSLEYKDIKKWKDLSKKLRSQVESFFKAYNEAKKKEFQILKWRGPKTAYKLIERQLLSDVA